jgi:sugar/nucleoside kinase (ribokinase family)
MVDIIVIVADQNIERITMTNATSSFLLLEQGRKIEAESISEHIGGGAVNAAVAMARLGHRATPIVKLGEDVNGARIVRRLEEEGIDVAGVLRDATQPTGTAVMVSSHDRNATIFTQRGANTGMTVEELAVTLFADTELVYITNLSNASADCFPALVKLGCESGAFVATNPGIRQLTSRTQAFVECLPGIDLLAVNRVEAEALVPAVSAVSGHDDVEPALDQEAPRLLRGGLSSGGFDIALATYFARLREAGLTAMLITDGTGGAYLAGQTGIHHCPSLEVAPKGTAGAGDAFTSTLSVLLGSGEAPDAALRMATVNAASVVSEVDTQSGLLRLDDLRVRAREAKAKLPVRHYPWNSSR